MRSTASTNQAMVNHKVSEVTLSGSDAYVNDPLVYRGKIRARLGVELIKTIQKLPCQMPEINLPILIMHL